MPRHSEGWGGGRRGESGPKGSGKSRGARARAAGLGRALAESRTPHASQALYESGGPWRCRLELK